MERKVTGLNIDLEKIQVWPTPLPLFQHRKTERNKNAGTNLSKTRTRLYVKPPVERKQVKAATSGESVPIQVTTKLPKTTMPRRVVGLRERHSPEMVDDATITVPIQVHCNETQTEEFPEPSIETFPNTSTNLPGSVALKLTVDRATSPIHNPNGKQLFEELEQITGHIIIQKFITRSEEEFQQLIKIRFPGMKVRETTITHSSASFLPLQNESYPQNIPRGKVEEDEIGQERNSANSSFKLPQTILEEHLKSELEKIEEVKQFQSALEEPARGAEGTQDTTVDNVNTWKDDETTGADKVEALEELEDQIVTEEESDTEDEPSLIEIKEVVMNPFFSVSNSQTIPSKRIEIQVEDKVQFLENDFSVLEKEIGRNASKEDPGSDSDGATDLLEEGVYNSKDISEEKQDPMTGENVDKVESESEMEDGDLDGTLSTVSVIHNMDYVDGDEKQDTRGVLSPPSVTLLEPEGILVMSSKSVATQTDARSSLRRSRVRRDWDSAQSSSNSSTPSLLDLQLRVQKLDVRLRVGGGKRRENRISATFHENIQVSESDHLDILEVHGTKIKLQEDPTTFKM